MIVFYTGFSNGLYWREDKGYVVMSEDISRSITYLAPRQDDVIEEEEG